MNIFNVNHLALLVSAVVQFLLGWVWYGVIFKKSWTALVGFKEGSKGLNPIFAMACSFVANLILSFALVHLILLVSKPDFISGASIGIICWLGFMAAPLFTQHIFERRPANLFAINAAYWMLAMALAGGILAVWR
jgi:hypothetical protein